MSRWNRAATLGVVCLTGFGIASRLPRERQNPAAPETVAGTLAWMSPEQTGRMNRSIDTRGHLYSLGVTLYQMLTGALPFAASDPLEWVHCHIARQPVASADRSEVPKPLSAIIMTLLARNAEDRYQTAAGLRAQGRIDSFPLDADDLSDWLLIPEKLYAGSTSLILFLPHPESQRSTGTAGSGPANWESLRSWQCIRRDLDANVLRRALPAFPP